MEKCPIAQCSHIRKLIFHNLMRHKPAKEDTSQEAHQWQEQLSRHEVESVEDGHAKQLDVAPGAHRKGANDTYYRTSHRYPYGCTLTSSTYLLLQECRTHLML